MWVSLQTKVRVVYVVAFSDDCTYLGFVRPTYDHCLALGTYFHGKITLEDQRRIMPSEGDEEIFSKKVTGK